MPLESGDFAGERPLAKALQWNLGAVRAAETPVCEWPIGRSGQPSTSKGEGRGRLTSEEREAAG